uniref:Uncharacterized protein n=1 Tax=Podoviridae sp. ctaNW81 TaxID=2826562 RepID=A0A8S5M591_9CAUD|nr:MAG TPA: hypothetical protein [Podoviridae sp. ctaNW81]
MTRLTRIMLNGTTCDKCLYSNMRPGLSYCRKVGGCLDCPHKVKHKNVWGYDCICLQQPTAKEERKDRCHYYKEYKE